MCRPVAIAAMIIVAVLVGFYGVPGTSSAPPRDVAAVMPPGR